MNSFAEHIGRFFRKLFDPAFGNPKQLCFEVFEGLSGRKMSKSGRKLEKCMT